MTRYDYPGAPARREDGRGAAAFALLRAWAAGIVALVVTEYAQATLVYDHLAGDGELESFGGRMLLVHLPNALCVALAAWAAGRVHSDPFRWSSPQHLAAVLAVPVVAQLLSMVVQWDRLALEGLLLSNAVLVVGCVAGYAADRLQDGD
ncbi:hypothetical protein ABT160_41100 [Streptomyces sp. NPDC001941]|uniref:hypothetical protein n=1 Tax=Streptomyces sp. NPDC001941 TaxID=3154659 RepID=UPI0033251CEE